MAIFFLDHNVRVLVAELLRASGQTAVTARDLFLTRATDDELLLAAAERGWTLVTNNRKDFELLHDAWLRWSAAWGAAAAHAGILVLPQPWPADRSARVLRDFLASSRPLSNALYVFRGSAGGWDRRALP